MVRIGYYRGHLTDDLGDGRERIEDGEDRLLQRTSNR